MDDAIVVVDGDTGLQYTPGLGSGVSERLRFSLGHSEYWKSAAGREGGGEGT